MTAIDGILICIGLLIPAAMLTFVIVSVRERERRAAGVAAFLAFSLPLPYLALGLGSFAAQPYFAAGLLVLTAAAALVLGIPMRSSRNPGDAMPAGRMDERDIMFSRRLLKPGTERFEEYYRDNPDNRAPDDHFRSKAGLLSKTASNYEPWTFAAAHANFSTVASLKPLVARDCEEEQIEFDPAEITGFIKSWASHLGAVSVGVTELRDYHYYSVVGRGDDYGKEVTPEHRYGIALTVEMDKEMIDAAPFGPTVMESGQQYLTSGTIAVQVAEFIRNLGYPARAHIDGNYRVVCPLVARDAGLGEIGRMGLLMTPSLGPRVRIAVVTTDLPLELDERRYDSSMIDFCILCKKCADACPSEAIPFDDRVEVGGVRRWRIDSEACFTFWCVVGTDCARCVKVCPYSHPDTLLHSIVRAGTRNSALFRRAALAMDDLFYGRKPAPAAFPDWMQR
jgi:reductive dehalogenase